MTTRGRRARDRARRRRHHRLEPRRARRGQRPRDDRQPRPRSSPACAGACRCSSTAASAAAPTSSRRSRSARTPSASAGPTSGDSRPSARRASRSVLDILRAELTVNMRQAGTASIADIKPSYRRGQPTRLRTLRGAQGAEPEVPVVLAGGRDPRRHGRPRDRHRDPPAGRGARPPLGRPAHLHHGADDAFASTSSKSATSVADRKLGYRHLVRPAKPALSRRRFVPPIAGPSSCTASARSS